MQPTESDVFRALGVSSRLLRASIAWLALLCFASSTFGNDNLLVITNSVPLKVIVRQETAICDSPHKSSKNRPVHTFDFYYVFKPSSDPVGQLKNDFYRVASGTTAADERSWLHKDGVVEWSHRQALGTHFGQSEQSNQETQRD